MPVPKPTLLFFIDFLFQNSSFVGFETRQTQGLLWGWGHLLRRKKHQATEQGELANVAGATG
jgi:hypothetical protein